MGGVEPPTSPAAETVWWGARNGRRVDQTGPLVQAGDAVDPGHLQRLRGVERREDPRQAPREHRLPRAGRTLEEQVMAARGGDLEREQRLLLAAHVAEVGVLAGRRHRGSGRRRRGKRAAAQRGGEIAQVPEARHAQAVDERGLGGALLRDEQGVEARPRRPFGHRQRPPAPLELTAERELAEHREAVERQRRDLPAGREDAGGDRDVEPGAGLAQVGRREVRGDAPGREVEPGVRDRGAHPLPRLPHGRVSESDDREGREAGPEVHLDADRSRLDPVDGEGGDAGEHERHARRRRVPRGPASVTSRRRPAHAAPARRRPAADSSHGARPG